MFFSNSPESIITHESSIPQEVKPKNKFFQFLKNKLFWFFISLIFIFSFLGFLAGALSVSYFYPEIKGSLEKLNIKFPGYERIEKEVIKQTELVPQTTQEELTIKAVKEVSPSVVSIVISKDVPIMEQYFQQFGPFEVPQYRQKGVEKQEIGGGTGFIVSEDGLILTNKHVVSDNSADYTVFTNDGKKFTAKILAKDPSQDLAIIKIEPETGKTFSPVTLGDSDKLQIGQAVITIGNALGEFRNTVSVGVVSGLGRTISAASGGFVETLEDVIQTDAAINPGNSGGSLLNLKGEVVGVNTAMATGAENIGFAIPINKAKRDIEQVKKTGKIVYPYLGIYYCLIDKNVQEKNNLSVDYGVWIGKDGNCQTYEAAVASGSVAQKAGLKRNDIILEFNGEKITTENPLKNIIMKYSPGDSVVLKILRGNAEDIVNVVLGEMKN